MRETAVYETPALAPLAGYAGEMLEESRPQWPGLAERSAGLLHELFEAQADLGSLAIADCERDVGLDVEVVQPDVGMFDVARTQFPGAELDVLLGSPPDQAMVEFYRFWTRREALAKADGRGLADWPWVESPADLRNELFPFELIFGGKHVVGTLVLGASNDLIIANQAGNEPEGGQA